MAIPETVVTATLTSYIKVNSDILLVGSRHYKPFIAYVIRSVNSSNNRICSDKVNWFHYLDGVLGCLE